MQARKFTVTTSSVPWLKRERCNLEAYDKYIKKLKVIGRLLALTQNPITSFNVHTFPILHALLRGLNYYLKIIYKLNAGVTVWKESEHQASLVDKAKKQVRETIKAKTGMIIDRPDSVAGRVAESQASLRPVA